VERRKFIGWAVWAAPLVEVLLGNAIVLTLVLV